MPAVIIGFVFLIFALVFVVLLSIFVVLFDVALVGQDFTTSKKAIKKTAELIRRFKGDEIILYDLGSCRGDFLLGVSRYCPQVRGLGVDNSKLRVLLSKIKSFLTRQQAIFVQGELFEANVSKADVVYVYLDISAMGPLQKKLSKELKSGAMIITNTQCFPDWKPAEVHVVHENKPDFEKLFVYFKN